MDRLTMTTFCLWPSGYVTGTETWDRLLDWLALGSTLGIDWMKPSIETLNGVPASSGPTLGIEYRTGSDLIKTCHRVHQHQASTLILSLVKYSCHQVIETWIEYRHIHLPGINYRPLAIPSFCLSMLSYVVGICRIWRAGATWGGDKIYLCLAGSGYDRRLCRVALSFLPCRCGRSSRCST
jgi:hypothetical protein